MTARIPELSRPTPLNVDLEFDDFNSGVEPLDDWLNRFAGHNDREGGPRTFVVCAGRRVVGYYTLALCSVTLGTAIGRLPRDIPNPVPVVLLGRIVIDQACQSRGLGADLLRDAVLRVVAAGDTAGIRAILVHAISPEARTFCEKQGFRPSPIDPMTFMITMSDAKRMLGTEC